MAERQHRIIVESQEHIRYQTMVQQHIAEKVETHYSITAAKKSLCDAIEYCESIREHKTWLVTILDMNDPIYKKRMTELDGEYNATIANISILRQEIREAERDNDWGRKWQNIVTAQEAHVTLECMFTLLVDTKRELQRQNENNLQVQYQAQLVDVKKAYHKLADEYDNAKTEFERKIQRLKTKSKKVLQACLREQRKQERLKQAKKEKACLKKQTEKARLKQAKTKNACLKKQMVQETLKGTKNNE